MLSPLFLGVKDDSNAGVVVGCLKISYCSCDKGRHLLLGSYLVDEKAGWFFHFFGLLVHVTKGAHLKIPNN